MQKYHDEPKQYKGYLKSALEAIIRRQATGDVCSRLGEQLEVFQRATGIEQHDAICGVDDTARE